MVNAPLMLHANEVKDYPNDDRKDHSKNKRYEKSLPLR